MYLDIKYDVQVRNVWVENRIICLKFTNDAELRFPASKNKKLAKATDIQLNNIELICDGTGLHWNELDEDLSVSGILDGRFG
ncbi:MAG: hypothetical protein HW421_2395 [Ignavibacteria bacterium]|nr:hypothetical protein [Ignavibacteria bacterium]